MIIKNCFQRFLLLLSFLWFSQIFIASAQINFESSNLPIIIINTEGRVISDEPKVTAKMSIINNGEGVRNKVTDIPNDYDGLIGIEFRGASSQFFYPKKSFGIEIRNSEGEDEDASLLGLPKESDWVLYAPYGDKTFIRDVLTYQIGNKTGQYATRTKFCELILNGNYEGVYVLIEKIKRNKNRVNIDKLEETENSGDDLTGGYIFKIDKVNGSGGEGWFSQFGPKYTNFPNKIYFQYEYPKQEDLTFEQKSFIKNYIDDFENALNGKDFSDPSIGYSKYIDVPSFIDYMLITEACKNVDGYRISAFFHKEKDSKGGKLFAGPLWDYNLAYGNANYCSGGSPTGWALDYNTICPDDEWGVPFWWERLKSDKLFGDKLADRWLELRQSVLNTSNLHQYIDSTSSVLEESEIRNFQRWPILGSYVWPNNYIGKSYQDEVNFLKDWISQRLDWIDQNIGYLTPTEDSPNQSSNFSAYPNPFNTSLTFDFDKKVQRKAIVKIYDLYGKNIETLQKLDEYNDKSSWLWNGKSDGKEVANGVYFSTLETEGKIIGSKLIVKGIQ